MLNKGFDYWCSEKVLFFEKKYWMMSIIYYLLTAWLAISWGNPFVFFLIGCLPYLFIVFYKKNHDPIYNLKNSIDKIDPQLFELILEQRSELNIQIQHVNTQKKQIGLLYAGLLLFKKDGVDQRIVTYIKNIKRINWISMVSLSTWFFLFFILLFLNFISLL